MAWSGGFETEFGTQMSWPDGTMIENTSYGKVSTAAGRNSIREISPGIPNVALVGIVLTKQSVRSFPSKKNPGTFTFLFSFTLRDSPSEFINATCWGSENHIVELSRSFKIGDVIEVRNPHVQSKPAGENADRFGPWTPVGVELNISETRSTVCQYSGWDFANFNAIQHVPVKDNNDYYTLGDILANGQSLHGEHITLLTLVREIGTPRDLVTKTGRKTKRCEVKLMDETCPSFTLMFWDEENIDFALTWSPRDTVIFASDVRASYDDYRRTMIATVDSKTIFTVNPDTREAHSLYTYGQSFNFDDDGMVSGNSLGQDPDLENITDVYTVQQLKSKSAVKSEFNPAPEYGILYAFISSFDIDSDIHNVVSVRCTQCKFRVDRTTGVCQNGECTASMTGSGETQMMFDVQVNLSDQTGTFQLCKLGGNVAEQMFGLTVEEFCNINDDMRTQLKWKYLLEKCKVYFKMFHARQDNQRPLLRILSCCVADPYQAVQNTQ
ncbi:meiosis-specific with OB domain-containing protein-like isoform X2 [Ptychodera flava]|uniref:meiosis-specific with OB domain-containing protein-like isoform X2 n=1 Tax=Ptychodera flava TaxID=63121 RepID=UPI00396A8BEB